MGRKRNIFIREFFDYNIHTDTSVCKTCLAQFNGSHVSNLKRHVMGLHYDLYQQESINHVDLFTYHEKRSTKNVAKSFDGNVGNVITPPLSWYEQKTQHQHLEEENGESLNELENKCIIPDLYQESELDRSAEENRQVHDNNKVKMMVEFSKKDISDACLDFITTHNLPFTFFHTHAFINLTKQIFHALKMTPIDSSNVMELVLARYNEIKTKIIQKLKGRIISIKIDYIRDRGQTFVSISAQIIEGKILIYYTLLIQDISHHQRSQYNLREILEKVLQEFEITKKQIYTLTSDDDSSIIQAVRQSMISTQETEDLIQDENHTNLSNQTSIELLCAEDSIFCNKSAVGTLQLAMEDFLTSQMIATIVLNVRQLTTTLTTANIRHNLPMKAQLDVPKRWHSTFRLLERFIEYKDICVQQQHELPLTEEAWHDIEAIVIALRHVSKTTIKLQQEQLLLGDFYKEWISLKLELKSVNSSIATTVLNCIEKVESQLLNNQIINAALYLDPRLRRLLTSTQKENARTQLKKVATQMNSAKQMHFLHTPNKAVKNNSTVCKIEVIDLETDQFSSSLLRDAIRDLEVDSSSEDDDITNCNSQELALAYTEIDTYKAQRVDIDEDLLDYWEDKKHTFRFLCDLAHIVHAVPTTQNTISSLRWILDELSSCRLTKKNLCSILFIKLNETVFAECEID